MPFFYTPGIATVAQKLKNNKLIVGIKGLMKIGSPFYWCTKRGKCFSYSLIIYIFHFLWLITDACITQRKNSNRKNGQKSRGKNFTLRTKDSNLRIRDTLSLQNLTMGIFNNFYRGRTGKQSVLFKRNSNSKR